MQPFSANDCRPVKHYSDVDATIVRREKDCRSRANRINRCDDMALV
jgi:hypothetical protein